jgi:hypothetical protein
MDTKLSTALSMQALLFHCFFMLFFLKLAHNEELAKSRAGVLVQLFAVVVDLGGY